VHRYRAVSCPDEDGKHETCNDEEQENTDDANEFIFIHGRPRASFVFERPGSEEQDQRHPEQPAGSNEAQNIASSEESVGEGERQGWLSTRNLRSFLQVESARQNATFIFGRERRETGENVGHVKFCCNSASEVEDMKHSRLVGLFVALFGVLALFSSLNKPGVAALRFSEVLGLIGSGMCFGVGFVGLMGKLRVRD
jgi:hypothetical protein